MKVRDAMAADVRSVGPGDSIAQAARLMSEVGTGFLPVAEADRPVGVVTDRDIVTRFVAGGGGDALGDPVSEVMTSKVTVVGPDDDLGDAADAMKRRGRAPARRGRRRRGRGRPEPRGPGAGHRRGGRRPPGDPRGHRGGVAGGLRRPRGAAGGSTRRGSAGDEPLAGLALERPRLGEGDVAVGDDHVRGDELVVGDRVARRS